MADTAVKRVGGKIKLRKWIKSHLPHHTIYCEPFGGSFAVGLIADAERLVYNDLDAHIYNFFKTVRDHKEKFTEKVRLTPYSRLEFEKACEIINDDSKPWLKLDPIEWARLYLVFNRQSFAGKEDESWCTSKEGENIAHTWKDLDSIIYKTSDKLRNAFIENLDYRKLFKKWDTPYTCFYIDPPYLDVEADYYNANKKDGFDHVALANAIKDLSGSVVISYYDSDYIRGLYPNFNIVSKEVVKHMQTKEEKDKATEILLIKSSDWSKSFDKVNEEDIM